MGGLSWQKSALFVQRLAEGVPPRQAALASGYSRRRAVDRAARPDIAKRVAAVRRENAYRDNDVPAILDVLIAEAKSARDDKSAALYISTKALIAEAERLISQAGTLDPAPSIASKG
jgi:phage terminase small subunit